MLFRSPECITDYDSFFEDLGFTKEAVRNEYVPVNNSMLAKAEIPFLIFERNRGKCFIEMY